MFGGKWEGGRVCVERGRGNLYKRCLETAMGFELFTEEDKGLFLIFEKSEWSVPRWEVGTKAWKG